MNFSYKVILEIPVRVQVEGFSHGTLPTQEFPGYPEEWDDFKVMLGKVDITDYLPREVINSIIDEIPEQAREVEVDWMISKEESRRDS